MMQVLVVLLTAWACAVPAAASKRLAFIVGISNYGKSNGLDKLKAPANDAEAVKTALEALRVRFDAVIYTDKDLPDKAAFDKAFEQFLNKIEAGDEVLFYFSGHGNYVPGQGNVFLLPDGKSEAAFLKGLSVADARALDTNDRKTQRYQEWLSNVAIREQDIEKAIAGKKPNVTILIADACRSLVKGTKGASLEVGGVRLPQHTPRGTFRLYSAGIGQFSLDSVEPIFRVEKASLAKAPVKPKNEDDGDDENGSKKSNAPTNSLFTKILLGVLLTPGLEFTVMAAQVRIAVRRHADTLGQVQIPDYSGDPLNNEFYFSPVQQSDQVEQICSGVEVELERLRLAVAAGSIGRDVLLSKKYELAPCGRAVSEQVDLLVRMEAQGASASTTQSADASLQPDPNDATQVCEIRASSPFDPNRTRGLPVDFLQQLSLATLSGEVDTKTVQAQLKSIKDVCEKVLQERPKVARFSYLTGRVYQAIASISTGLDQQQALAASSAYFQQAADLGYSAAFNDLALLHKAGDYYAVSEGRAERRPADRAKAVELLQRGASLNHVVAQYNLGLAYLNGDLGIDVTGGASGDKVDSLALRKAEAFRYLSQAAERGFVPALIETAKLLHDGNGIIENPKRAIELLEIAASRGSWEAMYWIGWIYHRGRAQDHARAIVWYARAAESGDARAQERLAEMMTAGQGLPAPQREAAGRYWRLAADAGRRNAQVELAVRLHKGEIPFRPVVDGPPDGGALEIRTLFTSAFLRGDPKAGLELARLFRTGFPKDRPSRAIPKSPEAATKMLWFTIDKVRQAEPDSAEADPKTEARAAFELIALYDEDAAANGGRSTVLTEDQINQLRKDYGDGSRQHWIRADGFGNFKCGNAELGNDAWVLVWNWARPEPPTRAQFDWIERKYRCREKEIENAKLAGNKPPSDGSMGFTAKTRETVAEKQKQALKDTDKQGAKGKSFVDRMIELAEQQSKN